MASILRVLPQELTGNGSTLVRQFLYIAYAEVEEARGLSTIEKHALAILTNYAIIDSVNDDLEEETP